MASPRFSVVIAAFNAAGTVASAVSSVLAQTQPDLEVIVVDDGSSDRTSDVVAGIDDPRVRLIGQPNRGTAAARNAGIAIALGTYVAFLDSDDLYLPGYLELSERALGSAPDVGFAYTDAYVFDDTSGRVRRRSAMARNRPPVPAPTDRDQFLLALLERNFVFVAAVVPRDVLGAVGGFDESLHAIEDYDLWLRILLHGYRAAWVEGQHVLYRRHPGQLSRNLVRMADTLRAVYDHLPMDEMPTDAHRALLARRRAEVRRDLKRLSRFGRLVPLGLVAALKRAGVGEAWYDAGAPANVVAAFPDLTAV
ncbi:MAG: glycosyltransferase [Solirubrobacteraceae bacterium]